MVPRVSDSLTGGQRPIDPSWVSSVAVSGSSNGQRMPASKSRSTYRCTALPISHRSNASVEVGGCSGVEIDGGSEQSSHDRELGHPVMKIDLQNTVPTIPRLTIRVDDVKGEGLERGAERPPTSHSSRKTRSGRSKPPRPISRPAGLSRHPRRDPCRFGASGRSRGTGCRCLPWPSRRLVEKRDRLHDNHRGVPHIAAMTLTAAKIRRARTTKY